MNTSEANPSDLALRNIESLLLDLAEFYKDADSHPNVFMEETVIGGTLWTAFEAGDEATNGVADGVDGCAGRRRADGHAARGYGRATRRGSDRPSYASKATATDHDGQTVPVSDMCGHDMHATWLVGATKSLAEAKTTWRGTIMAGFQPGEETAEGAQAMIDDGLFKRFSKPDVVLGQHVMVGRSGTVVGRAGAITSAADSLQIRLFGVAHTGRCRRRASIPW